MKNFEYFAPKDVEEACFLLDRYQEEAKIIAGGQSLLILMKNRLISPKYLIDIKGMSQMDYITFDKGEGLKIGALTTHRSIECSSLVQGNYPVLSEMETRLASIQIRKEGIFAIPNRQEMWLLSLSP
jgi:carbon-monoxide dehydrogenase medium subunit